MNKLLIVDNYFSNFTKNLIDEVSHFDETEIYLFINGNRNFEYKKIDKILILLEKRFYLQKNDYNKEVKIKDDRVHIIKDQSELKLFQYDWIIFLQNCFNENQYIQYAKNGILTLNLDKKYIQNQIVKHKNKNIPIAINYISKNNKQKIITNLKIDVELGLYNNYYKYRYYQIIALKKFLRNDNYDIIEFDKLDFVQTKKIILAKYYLFLIKKIIERKLKPKTLSNWYINIEKDNKNYELKPHNKNFFWADPFPFLYNNDLYIFLEQYDYKKQLGNIIYIELDEEFNIKNNKTVLSDGTHFSFPNIFWFKNNFYMIPENSVSNKLTVYECENFPDKWVKKVDLMQNIKLLDVTWIFHEAYYWIFANKIQDFEYDNNEFLYLYYADNLFSTDWKEHPQNPIVSGKNCARNAGNIFKENDKLYRPSQNSEKFYGQEIVINEIIELNTKNYIEKIIHKIKPDVGKTAKHTINKLNGLIITDKY